MGDGHSIDTYKNWNVFAPFAVTILIGLPVGVASGLYPWLRKYERYTNLLLEYSKIVFRDALKREDLHRISLHGYTFSENNLLVFCFITVSLMSCVFISFWATFLIEETFVCDLQLDCFFINYSSTFADLHSSQLQRVDDCSSVDDNSTVICYQFVLDLTGGFASAVGFLTVAVYYVRVYMYILVWFREIYSSPISSVWMKRCSLVGCMSVLITPIFISVIIFIMVFSVPFFRNALFQTDEAILKFSAYWTCFVYGGPIAGTTLLLHIRFSCLAPANLNPTGKNYSPVNSSQDNS